MFFCVVYVLCDVWHCSPNPHDKSSSSNRSSKSEEEKKTMVTILDGMKFSK
jgi:hypothetical protein